MLRPIPEFPNFRAFEINDIESYYAYYLTMGLNPYVDIHPSNMLVWLNINNDLEISSLNNELLIKYSNPLYNNCINIIPLSNPIKDSTIDYIFSYLISNNQKPEIREIPSIICEDLDESRWIIDNDRDSYEYILDTDQQSKLQGGEFSRQRRRIAFFNREHINDKIEFIYYDDFNDNIKRDFIDHIHKMPFNSNSESTEENTKEPIAIIKNLEYATQLNKKALIIKINDRVVSLSMITYLDNNTAAINHLKVDYSVQYIFQYTIYLLAKILHEKNFKEMNLEQDLGIEGLRVFKERLKPSRLLEKKIILRR